MSKKCGKWETTMYHVSPWHVPKYVKHCKTRWVCDCNEDKYHACSLWSYGIQHLERAGVVDTTSQSIASSFLLQMVSKTIRMKASNFLTRRFFFRSRSTVFLDDSFLWWCFVMFCVFLVAVFFFFFLLLLLEFLIQEFCQLNQR